jgi:hypothetical protein
VDFGSQISICSMIEENHLKRSCWIMRREREREREEVGGSERHYIWGGGKKLYLRF